MSKKTVPQKVKLRIYDLMNRAVEEGIQWGWQRAHKHTETPCREYFAEQLQHEIMIKLGEIIDFDA